MPAHLYEVIKLDRLNIYLKSIDIGSLKMHVVQDLARHFFVSASFSRQAFELYNVNVV